MANLQKQYPYPRCNQCGIEKEFIHYNGYSEHGYWKCRKCGDIIPTIYKDWKKYDSDPNEIFKLLVKQGYPEYHAQFLTQELLSTPPSIDIQINNLKEVDITPEIKAE